MSGSKAQTKSLGASKRLERLSAARLAPYRELVAHAKEAKELLNVENLQRHMSKTLVMYSYLHALDSNLGKDTRLKVPWHCSWSHPKRSALRAMRFAVINCERSPVDIVKLCRSDDTEFRVKVGCVLNTCPTLRRDYQRIAQLIVALKRRVTNYSTKRGHVARTLAGLRDLENHSHPWPLHMLSAYKRRRPPPRSVRVP